MVAGALALLAGCETVPLSSASEAGGRSALARGVPVAAVLNEIRCDYLDLAYSDFARARRLAVGRISGEVTLSLSRGGTAVEAAVAPAPLAWSDDGRGAATSANTLAVPFALDPQLALNPAAAGLDCRPAARLARPILGLTALASALAPAQGGGPYLQMRSPLRYQGAFYLLRDAASGRIDAVPVRGDPARLGPDASFVHGFEVTVETGGASWFSDVGAATAEPRPSARRVRVPSAPVRSAATRPDQRGCVGNPAVDLVCY